MPSLSQPDPALAHPSIRRYFGGLVAGSASTLIGFHNSTIKNLNAIIAGHPILTPENAAVVQAELRALDEKYEFLISCLERAPLNFPIYGNTLNLLSQHKDCVAEARKNFPSKPEELALLDHAGILSRILKAIVDLVPRETIRELLQQATEASLAPADSAAVSDNDVLLVGTIPEGFLSLDEQWEVLAPLLVKPPVPAIATRALKEFRDKARLDRLKTTQPWRRFGRVRGKGLSIFINANDLKTYVDATLAAQRSRLRATAVHWSVCKRCKLLRPPEAHDHLQTCPICSDRYGPTFETLHALPERVRQCPWQDCGMIWLIATTQAHCAGMKPNTHPVQRLETVGWKG
jgi:hypothetical protein